MIINYSINKSKYKATFCHDKESPDIDKALSKLYCDKKMMTRIRRCYFESPPYNTSPPYISSLGP